MKNKHLLTLAVGALVIQLLVPSSVWAVGNEDGAGIRPRRSSEDQPQAEPGSNQGQKKVRRPCDALDAQAEKIGSKFGQQKAKVKDDRGKRDDALGQHWTTRSEKLADRRAKLSERHEERFGLLLEKAGDNAELKQAVMDLQAALQEALLARHAAFDQALEVFNAAVEEARAARRAGIDAAGESLDAAIAAALAAAKQACESEDADIKTVRTDLREALKAARDEFRQAVRDLPSYGVAVRALVQERNKTFTQAKEDFRAATEAARQAFKEKVSELRPDEEAETEDDDSEAESEE